MDKAISVLEELGAIRDGHLTALGRYMVRWMSLSTFSGISRIF